MRILLFGASGMIGSGVLRESLADPGVEQVISIVRKSGTVQDAKLLEIVHGSAEEAFDRSIDVHVSRLRHKLGDDPRSPKVLKTVRGMGYVLAAEPSSD